MRIVRTRRGARIVHGGHVVSEILSRPGPTHSVFDVLAAAVVALRPEARRIALLGFAGGGMLAPLRALGCSARVEGVDLSTTPARAFFELAQGWSGWVRVYEDDAAQWLARRQRGWDVIIEDLSQQVPGDVIKPEVSIEVLPELIARRLGRDGISVVNVLPTPGYSWAELLGCIASSSEGAAVVRIGGFENRLVLGGRELPSSAALSRRLTKALGELGSRLAGEVSVSRAHSSAALTPSGREGRSLIRARG